MARICAALLICSMVTLVGCNKNKTTEATETAPPPDTKGTMVVAPPPSSGSTADAPSNGYDSGDPKIVLREPATALPKSSSSAHTAAPRTTSTASKTTKAPTTVAKASKTGSATAAAGGKTYTVQTGDSMWKIASKTLGNGARWKEIAAVNPGVDPNKIKVGQKINLPA